GGRPRPGPRSRRGAGRRVACRGLAPAAACLRRLAAPLLESGSHLCRTPPLGRGVPPEKGKPVARRGRKARGPQAGRPGPPKGEHGMRRVTQVALDFLKREDGPTAVEYAVMLALIIVVCIAAITTLGTNANATFTKVGNAVNVGS